MPREGDGGLGSISEEKEDNTGGTGSIGGTPEVSTRRSLPKMAVSFGKKTKEKLTIKTSGSSNKIIVGSGIGSSNAKSGPTGGLVNGSTSGDLSDNEESVDINSTEMSSLSINENGSDDLSTPVNPRKNQQVNNNSNNSHAIDIDVSRSLQVSTV